MSPHFISAKTHKRQGKLCWKRVSLGYKLPVPPFEEQRNAHSIELPLLIKMFRK